MGTKRDVHGGGTRLPVAPIRVWLVQVLRSEGLWNEETGRLYTRRSKPSFPGLCPSKTVEDICSHLGIATRRLYSILYESEHVYLDVADRIFCRVGDPNLLRELYPELYDLPELDADEQRELELAWELTAA